jgi:chemotaxis family two-component system sensor kinase Cph1
MLSTKGHTEHRAEHDSAPEGASAGVAPQRPFGRHDLFAVIGHDLRQPLSAATMALELAIDLLSEATCADLVHSQLGLARRCMGQALLLAEDLVVMGQADAGALRLRPSSVDLASLLEETRALVALHAGAKHVELLVSAPPSLPCITADHDRLLQVLANVCGNAVKFTPANGRVTLAVAESSGAIEVSVADSGPGISASDLPHVFDRYWHSESAASGSGLGLSIAKWLVEAHGGRIEARSAEAGGLTVAFTIPLRPAELATGNPPDGGARA